MPPVRLAGRWLEGSASKRREKSAAVGAEGGLLVLGVYEAAPERRASRPVTSRALDAEDDATSAAQSCVTFAPLLAL